MSVRLLTLAIILFWLGSVGWLCAVVWAPPESRMAQIDPMQVYTVFFGWNDSVSMTLLEHGVRRGQITVAGISGVEPESGVSSRNLSISGSIESFDALSSSYLVDVYWKGTVSFTEGMEMQDGEFSVRIPNRDLSAKLSFSGESERFNVSVLMAGREVIHFDSSESEAEAVSPSPFLALAAMGLPGIGAFNPTKMELKGEARMGEYNFGGRDMRAYLLRLRSEGQGQELRIYFSEAGEPLKIESDLGFEAISEILVPLDAYKPRPVEKTE